MVKTYSAWGHVHSTHKREKMLPATFNTPISKDIELKFVTLKQPFAFLKKMPKF